jgi:hypothetical protein
MHNKEISSEKVTFFGEGVEAKKHSSKRKEVEEGRFIERVRQ